MGSSRERHEGFALPPTGCGLNWGCAAACGGGGVGQARDMTFTGGTGLSSQADQEKITAQRTTLIVVVLALILAGIRSLAPLGPVPWLVLSFASVFLPGLLSGYYFQLCWAVTRTTSARCRRRRPGFLTRCQDHRGANVFDLLGSGLAIAAGLMVLWAVLTLPDFSA